jgi:hypothetical protein
MTSRANSITESGPDPDPFFVSVDTGLASNYFDLKK